MKYNEGRSEHRSQPQVKESEMDREEEILRDALKHGVRNGAKPREEPHSLQEQNTFTKRHNYITVYEHDHQRARSHPNAPEDYRAHPNQAHSAHGANVHPPMHTPVVQNGNGSLGIEEFRKYCVFLTERMQKMEEQNDQLVRLAEQQKHEYNKVATQIAQSEMMQRRLQDECLNLRRQVQHLTSYNNKLKESVPLHGNNLLVQGEFSPDKHVSGYGMPARETVSLSSMQNLHSGTNQNLSESLMAQFGASLDDVSQRDLAHIKSEDMASIIELYNALQRQTTTPPRCQPSPPEISGEPHEGAPVPSQGHPLGVIHEQPAVDRSDYATPSSVCATRSCTCCNSRTATGASKLSSSPVRDSKLRPSNSRAKLGKSSRGGDKSQSFDNNAYIEVELKHYENPSAEVEEVESENAAKMNFRRDNRLRRSHNHYMNVTPKRSQPQRPSSLVLDLDTVQAAMDSQQALHPGVVTLSPVSPYENHVISAERNRNNSNSSSLSKNLSPCEDRHVTQKPPMSPLSPREKHLARSASADGKVWYPRSSSASSTHSVEQRLTSADSGHVTSPGSPASATSGSRKSFSKLEFIADLPPPPPPPPQADEGAQEEEEEDCNIQKIPDHVNVAPRTSDHRRNDLSPEDVRKHNKSAFSQIRPGKLSVWKQPVPGDGQGGPAGQKGAGWRRKSYAAACRKSQSLDHLYEQILMENVKEKKLGEDSKTEKTESGSTTFSTLQLSRNKPVTSPIRTLPEALLTQRNAQVPAEEELPASEDQEEDVFEDDLPPPPPPHILQEVMSRDGQTTGYAVMAPVDYDQGRGKAGKVTQHDVKGDAERPHQQLTRRSSSKSNLQKRTSVDRDPSAPQKESKLPASGREKSKVASPGKSPVSQKAPVIDSSRLPKSSTCDTIDADYDDIDNGLRRRRMSEGSAGRRKKELLESTAEDGKSQLRRRRSISSDFAVSRRRETALARHYGDAHDPHVISPHNRAQSVDQVTSTRGDAIPQRRFPATNPNMRLETAADVKKGGFVETKSPQRSPEIPRSIRTESLESGSSLSQCSQSTERRSLLSLYSSKGKAANPNQTKKSESSKLQSRGRSTSKTEVSAKKGKDAAPGGKKRTSSGGGSQSRSLVNIMKSKFGRSVSGNRSTTASKKTESNNTTKNPDPPMPEPQLKPASSFIDPRTLSLEPNSYLPPGKDGFSTGSKKRLALGGGSDAAVGRKLSQPYPNGSSANSASAQPLTKLVEEVVSDEGFAEGSTIERPDKDQIPEPDAAIESRKFEETSFPDVAVPRKSERQGKKDNNDWYESVVSIQKSDDAKAKRFQIVSTEDLSADTPENRFTRRGSTRQQQHTRPKPTEEPPYENLPIDSRHIMPHQINTFDAELNNNNEKRLSVVSKAGGEVFTAGVTIVRTPQAQQGVLAPSASPPTRPKPTRQLQKGQRSSPGSAIGRIMKTASRLSGSKEDISHKSDSSLSGGSTPKSKKPDKDLSGKKINYSDHQKVFEKAFISSVVEAELTQRSNSPHGSTSNEKSKCDSTGRTPVSVASSGADSVINGSVGTGSSFGSLPSDGLVDVTEFHGTTSSSASSDHVIPKPNQQRLSKSKRNSNSGFGFSGRAGNTGTNESSSSSSSAEIQYRGRSKTSSGIRSPAVSSPPSGSADMERAQIRSTSCATTRLGGKTEEAVKPPDYNHSVSKPPAYSEPHPANKTTPSIKSLQSRRSQSGSRISRLSTPATKLHSPHGKSSSRSHSTSSQDGSPSSAASKPQSPKLKLAPLNYGITPSRSRSSAPGHPGGRDHQEPVYENSMIAQQHHQNKFTPPPNSQIPSFGSSLRPPAVTSSSSSVPTTRPPSGCASSQLEARRTKRNIPSAVGLHRPRPVNLGVGAG